VQQTDADGFYCFTNLRPGLYTITQSQPAGFLDGRTTAGSLGGSANGNQVASIAVSAGASGKDYNFAELSPASLAGRVFEDNDNNGIQDPEEAGIRSVTVTLTGTDDRGQSVRIVQRTDANGYFRFTNLRPGTYTLTETQPAGYLDGTAAAHAAIAAANVNQYSDIVLTPGASDDNCDFAELLPASVSGCVYVDSNNDGLRAPGEAGIAGVTVTLTGIDDLGNEVQAVQTTAADGCYFFEGLRPGIYTITQTPPDGFLPGGVSTGECGGTAGGNAITELALIPGDQCVGYNFGQLLPAQLCGSVYVDGNGNGIKDASETPLSGVTVTLTGTDDLGQAVSLTQTTGTDGRYCFTDLRPGEYVIREVQPIGYLNGQGTVGSVGGTFADDAFFVTLSAGAAGEDYNFGEMLLLPPPPPPPAPPVPVTPPSPSPNLPQQLLYGKRLLIATRRR
jgi:protocatechuate 3,4-dioxygenase beta subunit